MMVSTGIVRIGLVPSARKPSGMSRGVDPVAAGPGQHDAAVDVERAERDDQRGHLAERDQQRR